MKVVKKCITILLFILAIYNYVRASYFVYQEGHSLSFQKSFEVDSEAYSREAKIRIVTGNYLSMQDKQHSLGMQILVTLVYKIFGIDHNQPIKIINLLAWGISIFCSAILVWKMKQELFFVAAVVFCISCLIPLKYFSSIVQYELILAALFLVFTLLYAVSKFEYLIGMVLGFIIIFKITYIVLIPLILMSSIKIKKRVLFFSILFTLITGLLFGSFSGGTSQVFGLKFRTYQNMNAQGYAFPYGEVQEPSGWNFIFTKPAFFLNLLCLRAAYFMGFIKDIWFLPMFTLFLERVFHYIFFSISFFSLILRVNKVENESIARFYSLFFVIFISTLMPLVFHGASFRFLIPLLPLFSILFVLGLGDIFAFVYNYFLKQEIDKII